MSNLGIILFFFVLLSSIYIFMTFKDPASPQLVFLVKLSIFFSSIYFVDYDYEIYLIFLLILLILILFSSSYLFNFNSFSHKENIYPIIKKKINLPSIIFWILSVPGLISLYVLVNRFGGFVNLFDSDGFLSASKIGTESFAGMGIVKSIITTFYPIHLYYFSYIINLNYKKYKITYFFYGLHFMTFIFFALLSFSRGTLLMMFVMMGLVWHYSRKRISTFLIMLSLTGLLLIASFYGVIRETVKFNNDEKIKLNYSYQDLGLKKTFMIVGTFPLETLLNTEITDKKLGLTYISGITIFIPRSIWPNKLDAGGVVFTKNYTNLYNEFSDFTTGLYPEAILNFGVIFGIIFGTLQLILLIYWLNSLYIKIIYNNLYKFITHKEIFLLLFYLYTLIAGVSLLTGEFTNVFRHWLVQIFVLYSVFYLIKIFYRIKLK
jgi:oligosaccharide repeat unit polymerase